MSGVPGVFGMLGMLDVVWQSRRMSHALHRWGWSMKGTGSTKGECHRCHRCVVLMSEYLFVPCSVVDTSMHVSMLVHV